MWAKEKVAENKKTTKKVKQSVGRLDVPPTKKISPATAYKRGSKYKEDFLDEVEY